MTTTNIERLIGETFTSVENAGNALIFRRDGLVVEFYHEQDCCESVTIEDVCGDLTDLVGSPIVEATETTSEGGDPKPSDPDSWTWTFYRFSTVNGTVTVRWLGESNGCYSESVDLYINGKRQYR